MAEEETKETMEKEQLEVKEEVTESKAQETSKESPVEATSEEASKKKKDGPERIGIAYIYASSNNTIIHITDLAGNTISRVTGGMVTKHSRLKANPTIAMFAAKKASERARDLGFTSLYIRMRGKTGGTGTGPGAHAAVKTLDKAGFKIINVLETTKLPRGGPKAKGGKRGRRV